MLKPSEVKAKAQQLEEQNNKFRKFLKNRADGDELDTQFLKLHKELFAGYDCCKCANCCKMCQIILDDNEVERISSFLDMTENEFLGDYLEDAGAGEEKPYKFKETPCSFLDIDGCCQIQECKPEGCAEFPFTDHPFRLWNLSSIIANAEFCPIVFEILERLKVMYSFRNRNA
ncbi:MAG: YkgJ family cysteine cluster protein [Eubacteriaceae bacterium]|nr:YkgJ family cysteine cluster protein [Eubacteriaceae bacterium]